MAYDLKLLELVTSGIKNQRNIVLGLIGAAIENWELAPIEKDRYGFHFH